MNYSLNKIQLTNFGPFENSTLHFENKTYVIIGDNQFDLGQKTNGVGKSFLLDSIFFGLFGEPLSDCKLSDLIREGESKGLVRLELAGPKEIIIERTLGSKSSLTLLIDGEVQNFIKITDSVKLIEKEFGITKEDFKNYFLISKFTYKSFLSFSDSERVAFLSRFCNLEKIDEVRKNIKDLIKTATKEFNTTDGKINLLYEQLNKGREESKDGLEDLEDRHSAGREYINLLELKEGKLKRKYDGQIKKITKEIDRLKVQESEYRKTILNLNREINNEQGKIINYLTITCSGCNTVLNVSNGGNVVSKSYIQGVQKHVSVLKTSLDTAYDEQKILCSDIFELESKVSQLIKKEQGETRQLKSELRDAKSELLEIKTKIEHLNKDLDPIENDIKKYEAIKLEISGHINEYEANITSLSLYQSHSITSITNLLESETNKQLKQIDSEFSIEIIYKDKLFINFNRNGKKISRISGGERARIDICVIFALQNLINLTTSTGINFSVIDEVVESLDSEGLYSIIKNMKYDRTTLFITHGKVESNIPNIIKITKNSDGISTFQ